MPFHGDAQRERPSVPVSDNRRLVADQVSDGEAAVMQFRGVIRLWRNAEGEWYYRDCQNTQPSDAQMVPEGTHFDPQRRIFGMSTLDTNTSGVLVEFDMPWATRGVDRLIFGIDRPVWVTRVYLTGADANTQSEMSSLNLYY